MMKILFKLSGDIRWLDRNDQTIFLPIPKEKTIFRWAQSRGKAILLFKRVIQRGLKKMFPKEYPLKFADILLDYAEIEIVKESKLPGQQ